MGGEEGDSGMDHGRGNKMHRAGRKKRDAIILKLKTILKINRVPFKRLQKLVGKLLHASIEIPMGKYLFGPIN